MRNFQDTFETRKRQFIRAFPIYMTVPLSSSPFTSFTKARVIFPSLSFQCSKRVISYFGLSSVTIQLLQIIALNPRKNSCSSLMNGQH